MADEIRITETLVIRKMSGTLVLIDYSKTGTFQRTMSGTKGPTPGALTATEDGIDISFAELTVLGIAWIHNLDAENSLDLGVWNPDQSEFYPFLRIKPSERYVLPLHPDLNQEYAGTGTGTTGQLNTLRAKGVNAPVNFTIEAFEA